MWMLIKFVLLVNGILYANTQFDDLRNKVELNKLENFLQTSFLNDIIQTIKNLDHCLLCNALLMEVSTRIKLNRFTGNLVHRNFSYYDEVLKNELKVEMAPLCHLLFPEDVCAGIIDLNADILFYIMRERYYMSSTEMCSILLQFSDCGVQSKSLSDWSVSISPGPQKHKKIGAGGNFTILHITDPHIDPLYKPGSLTDCKKPICCQEDSGIVTPNSKKAGFWGDYQSCDTPWHTWNTMLDQMKKLISPGDATGPVKYIYMTGDIINHRVWNTSILGMKNDMQTLLQTLKSSFPGIQVFPILGNHEGYPVNLIPDEFVDARFSLSWLYEEIDRLYIDIMQWLPDDPDIRATLKRGGYYTYLVEAGLRIVALNSNVCYTYNWWLLYNAPDPYGQLYWLSEILQKAEEAGEQVHILTHIPSGDDTCLISWSKNFVAILDRYSNIVRAMWSGHTHMSELRVYYNYNGNNSKPTIVNYVGGSVTTYTSKNPNFRAFTINSYDFDVLDFVEYSFDLDAANAHPDLNTPPKWHKLYSFKDLYGLDDCSPAAVDGLLYKMSTNHSVLNTYIQMKGRNSTAFNNKKCDRQCKRKAVCECAVTVYRDNRRCNQLTSNMD